MWNDIIYMFEWILLWSITTLKSHYKAQNFYAWEISIEMTSISRIYHFKFSSPFFQSLVLAFVRTLIWSAYNYALTSAKLPERNRLLTFPHLYHSNWKKFQLCSKSWFCSHIKSSQKWAHILQWLKWQYFMIQVITFKHILLYGWNVVEWRMTILSIFAFITYKFISYFCISHSLKLNIWIIGKI